MRDDLGRVRELRPQRGERFGHRAPHRVAIQRADRLARVALDPRRRAAVVDEPHRAEGVAFELP